MRKIGEGLEIKDAGGEDYLSCAGVCADPFSQDGHNGADYLVIVPDGVLGRMRPYYSELVVELEGEAPVGLQKKLEALLPEEDLNIIGHAAGDLCTGSDLIISAVEICMVRGNLIPQVKYMLAALIVPLFYIGLVFVCVVGNGAQRAAFERLCQIQVPLMMSLGSWPWPLSAKRVGSEAACRTGL